MQLLSPSYILLFTGLEQCFCLYQDPAIAVPQSCGYTTDTVTIAGNSERTAQTAGLHGYSAGKSRQNTNEDEKEPRKFQRILANKESARQTIRRRQLISPTRMRIGKRKWSVH